MEIAKISRKGYQFQNWSRTYSCSPELFIVPENVEQLREVLYLAGVENKKVRVVGCGASPSDICCTNDYLISLERFDKIIGVDKDHVVVQAGIQLAKLNQELHKHNLALPIMGSISQSTIGGVISTGTHGTGIHTGIIADYVKELTIILASGDVLKCSPKINQEYFYSALCGLGSIGIIIDVRIHCTEFFYLHQLTYPSTLKHILDNLDELVESCDHFRFLWFPHTDYVSVSITNRVDDPEFDMEQLKGLEWKNGLQIRPNFPYRLTSEKTWLQRAITWLVNYGLGYHSLQFAYWISTRFPKIIPYINRAAFWMLYSSPSVQLDVSYKVFNFECLFDQYVNEWSIPINQTGNVLNQLRESIDRLASTSRPIFAHFPVEVRFADSSDLYLSPTQGRTSAYINIICYRPYRKVVEHESYWKLYENILKPVGGRPHWAKAHRETASDFVKMYPLFRKWIQVRNRADPTKMFYNSYMERIFEINETIAMDLPMNFFSPENVNSASTPVKQKPEQAEKMAADLENFEQNIDVGNIMDKANGVELNGQVKGDNGQDSEMDNGQNDSKENIVIPMKIETVPESVTDFSVDNSDP